MHVDTQILFCRVDGLAKVLHSWSFDLEQFQVFFLLVFLSLV